jgi:hypothetical protein
MAVRRAEVGTENWRLRREVTLNTAPVAMGPGRL